MTALKAPFPWFGGKSRAAPLIWPRLGDVPNLVDPFAGSLAVLLCRPHAPRIETVNDKDGFLANFWRALQADPDAVAHHADRPVNENDQHAIHAWLVGQRDTFIPRLEGDPDFFDAKIAGLWAWGICCWIGGGWCSGAGPWHVVERDGMKTLEKTASDGNGVKRELIHLGNAGQGVNRQLVHLGNAGQGVNRQLVHLGDAGQGVNQQRPAIGVSSYAGKNGGERGMLRGRRTGLLDWMRALADRLRYVRVCCGDWKRVMGPSVTWKHGLTGIVLDPPYADTAKRDKNLYRVDSQSVAHEVRAWAVANGDNPKLRIVLCGYEGEHDIPDTWECVPWKTAGGYASQGSRGNANRHKERLWFSPHCLNVEEHALQAA